MSKKVKARDFFLYEKLNENETKNLRKSPSLSEEKKVLAEVFGLDNDKSKVGEIMLDFHSINYNFAKQHSFSNEKISVFLDMMNYLLYYMIDH
jgi:Cys-tRNA synthase (O-phospho-L-seryl-tRNA:Cys-tRNA synthase)